jgi:hypothetical protein
MSKKREYVRQSESLHPNAVEFASLVHDFHKEGKTVTRAVAIKWIISSYKREALIRYGANRRATDAIRAGNVAGNREVKREQITRVAVSFSRDGSTITERDAEAFFDTGLCVVMQRLVSSRAGTYVYDKNSKTFVPIAASKVASKSRNNGVVRKILLALSEDDLTASAISEKCCVDVISVRNNLNGLRRAGAVEQVGKQKGKGRGRTQIVYRLKEAVCNSAT